jgi:hypothetical protein
LKPKKEGQGLGIVNNNSKKKQKLIINLNLEGEGKRRMLMMIERKMGLIEGELINLIKINQDLNLENHKSIDNLLCFLML